MSTDDWNWKGKDGSRGGLLYEPGNWGDILKMLWLSAVLGWKNETGEHTEYADFFAGDIKYPLAQKTLFRFEQSGLEQLAFIRCDFVTKGFWPSSASAAALLTEGRIRVYDADAERRGKWEESGTEVMRGESGWDIMNGMEPSPDAIWLVDPYDFLAEWRERLPKVIDKARDVSVLVYIYNRSAGKREAFGEYRAFRNRLEDLRGDLPKRVGRAESDVFLPRAHHEMLFLPGAADRENPGLDNLFAELEARTAALLAAQQRASVYDA